MKKKEYVSFVVNENTPFCEGYITKFYGKELKCEAIHIELNYKIYIERMVYNE